MLTNKEIQQFYEELQQSIMTKYHTDEKTAIKAIGFSDMDYIISQIQEFVYHDPIEYWVESVWACYQRRIKSSV